MRNLAWVLAAGFIVLAVWSLSGLRQLDAGPPTPATAQLIALTSDSSEGHQQVTVIDPQTRIMSVYHIENATGVISLKSVRNISADLKMDEFNTDSPLPREIRAILTTK